MYISAPRSKESKGAFPYNTETECNETDKYGDKLYPGTKCKHGNLCGAKGNARIYHITRLILRSKKNEIKDALLTYSLRVKKHKEYVCYFQISIIQGLLDIVALTTEQDLTNSVAQI